MTPSKISLTILAKKLQLNCSPCLFARDLLSAAAYRSGAYSGGVFLVAVVLPQQPPVAAVIPVEPIEVEAIPRQLRGDASSGAAYRGGGYRTAAYRGDASSGAAYRGGGYRTAAYRGGSSTGEVYPEVVRLELAVLLVVAVVAVTVVPVPVLAVVLPVGAITAVVITEVTTMAEVQTSSSVDSSGSLGSLTMAIPMATIHIASPILTRTATPTLIPLRIRTILT